MIECLVAAALAAPAPPYREPAPLTREDLVGVWDVGHGWKIWFKPCGGVSYYYYDNAPRPGSWSFKGGELVLEERMMTYRDQMESWDGDVMRWRFSLRGGRGCVFAKMGPKDPDDDSFRSGPVWCAERWKRDLLHPAGKRER